MERAVAEVMRMAAQNKVVWGEAGATAPRSVGSAIAG
jgi:hypothetical protein